jgi:hypothetical protein
LPSGVSGTRFVVTDHCAGSVTETHAIMPTIAMNLRASIRSFFSRILFEIVQEAAWGDTSSALLSFPCYFR